MYCVTQTEKRSYLFQDCLVLHLKFTGDIKNVNYNAEMLTFAELLGSTCFLAFPCFNI